MPNPIWHVIEVEPLQDYRMLLTFENGEKRLYDAAPLLEKPVCASLKDMSFFAQVKAVYGTVVWSDEIDVVPENLYECSIPCNNHDDIGKNLGNYYFSTQVRRVTDSVE